MRVLIVSAVPSLAGMMQMALQHAGMATELAASMWEATASQQAEPAGVAILDLDLPDADPVPLAAGGASGVIALAPDMSEALRLRLGGFGADDVAAKPVMPRLLVARVRALERRRRRPTLPPPPAITVDRTQGVLADPMGRRTSLSEPELAALTALLDAEGASVSRNWIGRTALRRITHQADEAVDLLVDQLRRKLAGHGAPPTTIASARGEAYVIADPAVFAEVVG